VIRASWLAGLLVAAASVSPAPPEPPTPSTAAPGSDLRLAAESDRSFRRCVIGLMPRERDPYLLPRAPAPDPAKRDARTRFLLQRLSWLSFELLHGNLMRAAPPHTRFFVAVPPRPANVPRADLEATFREYLSVRAGFTAAQIAERVRFFRVPEAVPFPQDLSVVIGTDARDRLVIGLGRDMHPAYARATEALVAAFPDDFVLRRIGGTGARALSTEGGDISIVPGPQDGLRLVVGRHRVLRVLEREGVPWDPPPVVAAADVERVRRRYEAAFFGLPTIILGERLLARPDRSDEEVFHADMVTAVLRTRSGVKAFVPTYAAHPMDAVTRSALDPEIIRNAQLEYDDAAAQLARKGYAVVRIPFADHPVRSPVNVARFRDPRTGDPCILLGRYPSMSPGTAGGTVPLARLEEAFADLDRAVTSWRAAPSDATWAAAERSLEKTFRALDDAAAASNPAFEETRAIYEREGVRVLPVSLVPSGEGGLHCLVLQ
jgi:hypothetical protein